MIGKASPKISAYELVHLTSEVDGSQHPEIREIVLAAVHAHRTLIG